LQERQLGIIQIIDSISKHGVRVRILTPIDKDVEKLISKLKSQQGEERYQQQEHQQPYQKK
jgi:hypothetical protein